jgi:hypothetical protein
MQARITNQRVQHGATFSVASILRCANDVETHGLLGVAAIVPEALSATGWVAVDESARYWSHPLRFGPAVFDRFEVDAIEKGTAAVAWLRDELSRVVAGCPTAGSRSASAGSAVGERASGADPAPLLPSASRHRRAEEDQGRG